MFPLSFFGGNVYFCRTYGKYRVTCGEGMKKHVFIMINHKYIFIVKNHKSCGIFNTINMVMGGSYET